jgi:hypothetical protein
LPTEVEPAGVLLFKAFSYLGSYPRCTSAGPVPLTFGAFITAFVVLIGRLDKPGAVVSENLFFQSLSVLPAPKEDADIEVVTPPIEEEPVLVDPPVSDQASKGLSLADLGVDFNDLELDTSDKEHIVDQGSEILCRDLVELFVLLLWLGEADKQAEHDFKRIREMATSIVQSIKPIEEETGENLPRISHSSFVQWKDMFSPHLFKPLQSLIIKTFAYYDENTTVSPKQRLLPEDAVPTPDVSDILTPLYTTLLSWSIPEHVLVTKQWTQLYSADQNGFSMNRFESHVFKYPGPTLLIMQIDAVQQSIIARSSQSSGKSSLQQQQQHQSMTLGAYIAQPWKQSRQFWGSDQCFLFELDPTFDIFRPIHTSNHYIYCHHEFGIGFGASNNLHPSTSNQGGFILSLQNTLQEGIYENEAYPPQPSFESATQSRKHVDFCFKFETENIEVFGLGNEHDREKQAKEWKFERDEAARRAGLNIRQADGALDKELLKMAGIIDEDKRQDR